MDVGKGEATVMLFCFDCSTCVICVLDSTVPYLRTYEEGILDIAKNSLATRPKKRGRMHLSFGIGRWLRKNIAEYKEAALVVDFTQAAKPSWLRLTEVKPKLRSK